MTDYQFQVIVTRLNLLIDLFILNMGEPKPQVQLSETSYQIESHRQRKTVVTQEDANTLMMVVDALAKGTSTIRQAGG